MLAFDDEGNEISLAPAKETRSEPVTQTAHQGLDPEKRALLDTIAGGESPGYNAMYTGKGSVRRFTDFSDHPRSGDRISKGPNAGQTSSAAGRYQFTPSTWDRQAEKLGLPNFRPEHQDVAAADLAETTYGKRLLDTLKTGDDRRIADVGRGLNTQWTSLPGGSESTMSERDFVDSYRQNLAKYKGEGRPDAAKKYGFSDDELGPISDPIKSEPSSLKPSSAPIGQDQESFSSRAGRALSDVGKSLADINSHLDPVKRLAPPAAQEVPKVDPDYKKLEDSLHTTLAPQFVDKVRNVYEAASPDERQRLMAQPGEVGAVAQYIDQKYQGADRVMSTNPDLAAVGDRREDITLRNRLNGMEDQTAKQMADREVRFNSAPITGQAQSTNFDFERAKELRDAGPIQRGAIQGAQDLKSQAAGLHFMAADLADSMGIPGAKGYGRAQLEARKKLQMGENEMGQAPNEFNRHLESAIRSTISNAPSLAAGVFSGGEAIPLLGLGAQVTGDEYANGVERGLSKEDALKRSVLFGSAEVLGEKFGFKDQVDLLKRASGGNWKNFEGLFVKNLGEQLAGEMGTTYAQFKTDKSKQFGLNQDATAKDLLNQMKDTVYQTVLQTSMMGAPGAIRAANSRLKESDAKHDQPFSDAFTPVNDTYRQIIGTRIGALRNDPEFKEIMRHETNIDLSGMERAKAARQTLAERRSLNEVNKPSISGETNGQDANVSNSGNEGRERIPSETETGRTGRDGRVQSEQESTSPIISEYPTSNAQEANGSGAVNNAIEIGQPGEINGSSSAQSEARQGSGNSDQSSQGVQLGRQGDRNSQEEAQVNRFFMKPSPEGVQIVDAADHVISTHPQFSDAIEAFDQLQANADNQQTQTATNKETSDELQTTSKAGSEGARFQNPEGRRQQASKGTEQGSRQEAVQQRNHGLNDREERASKLDLLAQEQDNLGNHSEAADWRQKAADFRSGNFVPEAYEDANHPTGNVGEDVSGSSGTVQNAASGESGADVSTGSLGRGTLSERSSGDIRGAVGGTLASEDSSVGGRALTDKEESELRGHNLVLKKLGRSELTPKQFLAEQSTKLQPAASNRTVTDQEVVDAYNSAVGKYNKRAATENAAIDARGVGESKKVPRSNVKPATTLPSSGSLQRRTAESIAKIFGHKVIFVESADGKPLDIDGSIVGSHPNHILLAADSKQPLSRVTFHELVHGLRRNAPEIYGQLVRNLREHYNPIKVAKHLKDRGYDSDLPGSTDDPNHFSDENRNEEEWVADHLSDIIHDHKALKALAERMDGQKQGSGKTFLQHLKDFYESLISKLRGQGFGTESAVASKHLKKSRDAVVEALAAYHQQKELERFSDRNSDDSELDIAESKRKEEPANKKSIPSEMLLINDLVAAKKLTSSQNWQKGRDLKLALDERMNNAARGARVNLKSKDDFTLEYLTDLAVRDATEAMKVNSNAVGWYDGTVKEALDIMSQVHPELKTDPQAKFAFIWATAVTSNGLKVDKNFELAEAAYDYYKANGRMPTNIGIGTAAGKINEGLALFNSMMKKHGFEALQKFMTTKYSVRDIQKTHGMKAGGEGMNTMVYGSVILGPKIGNGFFSNLYGNFDQLTMDRWLMRTFGRWTGNLVTIDQDAIKDKRKKLRALIRMMTPQERKAFKASTTVDLRLDRPADDLAADIAKASMEPKLRESMNRVGGRPSHEFVELLGKERSDSPRESIGSEIRKMGNGLAKNIDGQNEAPGGSKERDFIRAVFSGALERLQKQYPKLTMADLQALLWYPEKRLYDSAKVDESKESYEDDEAPDYANAAEKIARRKGIDVARKRVAPTGRTARVGGGERGLDEGSDFREDSVDTSGPEERQNGLDDPQLVFSNRVKPAPKRTVTAYKLFRVEKSRPGELFPLFVKMREGATQAGSRIIEPSIPIGSWQDAEVGEQAASGKVKSRLGELAYRPGWHAGDLPLATHIGTNLKVVDGKRKPTVRAENQVWAEVEFAADHNWQPEADKRGVNEAGRIVASRAHITDRMPEDGFYRYKTSPNMAGTWLIGGSMKINRILSDGEVSSINSSAGTKDLPREKPFDAEKYGFLDSYPDIRFSNRTPNPPFYSQLARGFESSKMDSMPASQWRVWLQGNKAKLGIKDDEIAWTGIDDFLNLKGKEKLTKADIAAFLKDNGVQVKEVMKGGVDEMSDEAVTRAYESIYGDSLDSDGDPMPIDEMRGMIRNEIEHTDSRDAARYEQYALPGGSNYRELLLTLPEGQKQLTWQWFDPDSGEFEQGFATQQEAIDARPSISAVVSRFESNHGPQTYYSGHWEEPNVLAHIRFNDRTDADGNKVLFVQEIQSDWAQQGRKKGFKTGREAKNFGEFARREGLSDQEQARLWNNQINLTGDDKALWDRWKDEGNRWASGKPAGPFVENTKSWVSLALKRIIRYAAEGGYDKVAFANGEQSADLYDLSKAISRVTYEDNNTRGISEADLSGEPSSGVLKAYDLSGKEVISKHLQDPSDMAEIIGKDMASKLLESEPKRTRSGGVGVRRKELSGLDLKVGGEGMKSFYDKIVPQVANEVLKKVGGGRMESVEIDTRSPEDDSWYEEPTDKDVLKQAGFVITPAMRDKALDGMPLFSNRKNVLGDTPLATWTSPKVTPIDNLIYTLQDKLVDTKRVQEAITAAQRLIADEWNPYQKELLYHGRTAKLTDDFLSQEVRPLFKSMEEKGVSMDELEEYLHNRHAEERNNQIASINPGMPDGGSGIETQDALDYLGMLSFDKATDLEDLADLVDEISKGTKKLLVSSGLEAQQTIDAWDSAYQYYVPLQREELEISPKGQGTGSGHSIKGSSSKRATGSKRKVVDILANLMMQRERAIVRSEKNKVATALYGLAIQNENSGFWLPVNPDAIKDPQQVAQDLLNMGLDQADIDGIMAEPTETAIDSKTGLVIHRINPRLRNMDNVLATRINGKDRFLFFSKEDERSVRMVAALKNLDEDGLGTILTYFRKVTRWISAINTQYNPVFGVVNLARDVQGGMLNLSSTPLAGKQLAVLKNVGPAMKGIYSDLRSDRKNKGRSSSSWSTLWEEYQGAGGRTGYRDAYRNSADRAEALKKEIARIQEGTLKRFGRGIFDWLSDYNDTLENAIRLSAYRVAKDNGMSKDQAAALAKNLTVNFNKKGQIASQAGSLYAFFNAGIQGNFRLGQTLSGNAGKKILAGGLILGAAQAALLAAAGFDDDEPPEFTKERNLIIPVGGSKYITIPLPLGFHVIPNTSRILTELVIDQGIHASEKLINLLGSLADAFDPMGFSGFSYQTLSPSATDPLVALAENRNSFGREIYKKDRSSLDPSPGFARMKDTATGVSKVGAYVLNLISGGTDYKPGAFSPTPDQIDYLVGQATGGVGREIQKTAQFVSSTINGEDIPPHKIPLVGRFYGDAKSQASETSRFYKNLKELNAHDREIKGRIKDGKDIKAYQEEHPEAHMVSAANKVEKMLTELKTRKRLMIAKGASREEVKALEGEIASRIKQFNDDVKSRSQK